MKNKIIIIKEEQKCLNEGMGGEVLSATAEFLLDFSPAFCTLSKGN